MLALNRPVQKEIGRNARRPAKFEQGGFTSRRRRVRRPSFRAQVPETHSGLFNPRNLPRCSIALVHISRFTRLITTGNSFWLVCKNRNAVKVPQALRDNSPQSQLNLLSATLRSKKSRKTLIRFDERSSSG